MTSTAIELLLSKLPDVRRNNKGWQSKCPAHEDRQPSLSIAEGDDGRVLLHCHAGCTAEAICKAIGLTPADLFEPSTPSTSTKLSKDRGKSAFRRHNDSESKLHPTLEAAVAEQERKRGKLSMLWTYHDASGEQVGAILRWDRTAGKDILPLVREDCGWKIGGMPTPRPLYRLPDLADAELVYICEGEKATEAARSIGLVATTSAHGAESAAKTDWTPLTGKQIVILLDNDQAGCKYAKQVAEFLLKLSPTPTVRIVDLPDLPEHGDIVDWLEAHDAAEPEALLEQIKALSAQAKILPSEKTTLAAEQFQPFPVNVLPEPVRGFVKAGSKAIGCDPSYIALPMISTLAATIGNTRRLQVKRGWTVPAIIWTAVVGESGTSKTPAFKLVMRAVRRRQLLALERHREEMMRHDTEMACYEKELALWKRNKQTTDEPPSKPETPHAERIIVSDTTVEALAQLLLENPRGLLMARDELAGWIGSFDRYSSGKGGADASNWLSMYSGESIVVDRKTGQPRTIYVPQASVSVTGGIQPAILNRALGAEHRESGLAARLLLALPPRRPKRWTEADIAPELEEKIAGLIDRLFHLQPTEGDANDQQPVILEMTLEAKQIWKAFYNEHAEEQANLSGDISAAWSKLEEYAVRLALVVHFIRWAANDPTLEDSEIIDQESILAGIKLVRWFKGEARRVYGVLSESDEEGEQRQLLEWIERKGGSVTLRETQQCHRRFKTAEEAETALRELVKAGYGFWETSPIASRGGRPSSVFRLSSNV